MMTAAVVLLGGMFFGWYLWVYNMLVSLRNAVDQSWSHIDVELKRRFDLIQNLVAVVKGYLEHERETLERVTALRSRADQIHDAHEAAVVQAQLSQAMTRLIAVAEAYPDLKADTQYLRLQEELTETENRIAERRSGYNHSVTRYMNEIQSFPSLLVAGAHRFESRAFFDAPDELVQQVPKVEIP